MASLIPPAVTKRCDLCLTPTEVEAATDKGVTTFRVTAHTEDRCRKAALQRILALQELLTASLHREQMQGEGVTELGKWVGTLSAIVDIGRRWIAESERRWADIQRLRRAAGTGEPNHPLWQLELELSAAIKKAIEQVEMRTT